MDPDRITPSIPARAAAVYERAFGLGTTSRDEGYAWNRSRLDAV
jgi:hypothetical protein